MFQDPLPVTDPEPTSWPPPYDPEEEFCKGREKRKEERALKPGKKTTRDNDKWFPASYPMVTLRDGSLPSRLWAKPSMLRWWSDGCRGNRALTHAERVGIRCYDGSTNYSSTRGTTWNSAEELHARGVQEILDAAKHKDASRVDVDGVVARNLLAMAWPTGRVAYGGDAIRELVKIENVGIELIEKTGRIFEQALVDSGLATTIRFSHKPSSGVMITEFGTEVLWDPPREVA
jgi:hypothetical protein